MSHATLDRVLAGLVIALAATGLLSLRAGAPGDAWVFVLHGLLGGALAAATVVKLRRSTPRAVAGRRWGRLALALLVSLATVAALVGGFAWVASGSLLSIGSWTVMTLHAWVGLLLVPLVLVHLVPRRWRLLRPPAASRSVSGPSRRAVLAAGGLALAGVAAFGVAGVVERLTGGTRRFTGSRWLPAGGVPPVTTFFGEATPAIDPDAWRLTVRDAGVRTWRLADLVALGPRDHAVVLDCTSGWAMETSWRGVPLTAVVANRGRRGVRVTSVTGWSTQLTADEVDLAVLAMGVAGGDLPAGNGAPCRLVVPDRRGVDWVKWVTDIRVV